jgi:hypothetical protein
MESVAVIEAVLVPLGVADAATDSTMLPASNSSCVAAFVMVQVMSDAV